MFLVFVIIVVTAVIVGFVVKRSYDATVRHKKVLNRSSKIAEKFIAKTKRNDDTNYHQVDPLKKALFFRLCENPHIESKSGFVELLFGKSVDYRLENMFLDELEKMVDERSYFHYSIEYSALKYLVSGVEKVSTNNLIILLNLGNNVENFSLKDFFEFSLLDSKDWADSFEEKVSLWIEVVKEYVSIEKDPVDGIESVVIDESFIGLPVEWQFDLAVNKE